MNFTYCNGYMCTKKEECMRWHEHKNLLDNKIDTRAKDYVNSESCIQYGYNNLVLELVYGNSSKNNKT